MKNSGMKAIIFLMCISIFGCDVRILGSVEDIYFDGYADSKVRDNMIDDVIHIGDILIGDEETGTDEVGGEDIYTDYGSDDVDMVDEVGNDIYVCEQYKCENLIYGRDDVYGDKESGNIYIIENDWFYKYDRDGKLIWKKQTEYFSDCPGKLMMVDREESFYIMKFFNKPVPKGDWECATTNSITKYKVDGEVYKEVYKIYNTYAYIISIVTDDNGNLYIAGEYERVVDFGNGIVLDNSDECRNTGNPYNPVECYTDVFVAKFNREGKPLWAKSFEDMGEPGYLPEIVLINGFLYFDVIIFGEDVYSSYTKVIKLDLDGNYKWSRVLGDGDIKFTVDKDGSIYLYGLFDLYSNYKDSDKYKDLNIAKFDKNGEFIWGSRIYKDGEKFLPISKSISINEKSIYVSGYWKIYNFFLSKIYKDGSIIWYKIFNNDEINTGDIKLSISDNEYFYAIIPIYGNSMQIDDCSNKSFPGDLYKKYLLKFVAEPCENIEVKIK